MKLLLDENISFRVLRSIYSVFPGSIHVSLQEAQTKEDQKIFEYAKLYGFTILTFDEDFYDLQLLKGHPPKIIWLTVGNCSNNELKKIISVELLPAIEYLNHTDLVEISR